MTSTAKRDNGTLVSLTRNELNVKRQKTTDGPTLAELSPDLQLHILQYCNEKDLAEAACTSRAFRTVCKHHTLPQERWGSISVRCTSIRPLLVALVRFELQGVFARFPYLRLEGSNQLKAMTMAAITHYTQNLRLSVTRLDISMPSSLGKTKRKLRCCVPKFLSAVMPDLQRVDLSHVVVTQSAVSAFSKNCPNLEHFTWNSCSEGSVFANAMDFRRLSGHMMAHEPQLKEIYMDDSLLYISIPYFITSATLVEETIMSSSILYHLRGTLERVSIKNLTLRVFHKNIAPWEVSQNSLIEMVRYMPRLVWLRSDLSYKNIAMLKVERPEITFLT